jgi:ubiquinone biosynthesis protein COQ4
MHHARVFARREICSVDARRAGGTCRHFGSLERALSPSGRRLRCNAFGPPHAKAGVQLCSARSRKLHAQLGNYKHHTFVRGETRTMVFIQFQPLRALQAARTLFANPDDLPQVFTIVESFSGNTLGRIARRMQSDAVGQRLIAQRPDLVAKLTDRAALARLPEGTFGRAYLDFVERENISAAGIRAAAAQGMEGTLPAPLDFVSGRMRDTHDLWHVVTGYSGDVLGETALLAFLFAQTFNPGVALIIALGLLKTAGTEQGPSARATIVDGFQRGRRTRWLPAVEWEQLLAMPLSDVRAELNAGAPAVYQELRSAQLKAA